MILQWTSSVNNLTLPNAGIEAAAYDDIFSYEDVMKYHVWRLYTELSSSGWVPMSSSYSSSTGYLNGQRWPSIDNLNFPDKMADSLIDQDLYNEKDIVYTPSEHCWVTLKKVFSTNEIYYLTIDCRYPLPPHVSNTGIIIDKVVNEDATLTYNKMDNGNEKKLFIGPTSIEKMSFAVLSDNSTAPFAIWPNVQEINALDGICIRDNVNTKFTMTPAITAIPYGQDYVSRCVSFVDICILRATYTNDSEIARVTESDAASYVSATTRVRPRKYPNDENAWYICWGFDFLDDPDKSIKDKIDLSKYKYAFHKDASGHFIYQIYKIGDPTFRSGFGLLPVQNKNSNDPTSKSSFCINCNPSNVYENNSININTLGTEVALISATTDAAFKTNLTSELNALKSSKVTINNYFNTCYRNYNFSDGKSIIKAGSGGKIGEYVQLPIYAPTEPRDAALFVHSASYVSSVKVTPTDLMPSSLQITYAKKFTGKTENAKLELPCKLFTSHITNKREENKYIIKIPRRTSFASEYPVYIQEGPDKKILVQQNGRAVTANLNKISELGSVSLSDLSGNPFYLSAPTGDFSNIATLFKDLYLTKDTNKNSKISTADFINSFNPTIFENTKGYLKIYVGSFQGLNYVPRFVGGQVLWSSGIGVFIKDAILTDEAVTSIKYLYQDNPSIITNSNARDYLAYAASTMATPIRGWKKREPIADRETTQDVTKCYIDVPITDIYNLNACSYVDESGNALIEVASGDFDYNTPGPGSTQVNQYKGANFFSVFKSSYSGEQQPLAGAIYTFSNDIKSTSNASVFGTINENGSTDSRFITNKDTNNAYPELPIFVFSLNAKSMIKGYIPDITWSPTGVNECSVVTDNSSGAKNYKKVYWGGCWFPWVSDYAPDL